MGTRWPHPQVTVSGVTRGLGDGMEGPFCEIQRVNDGGIGFDAFLDELKCAVRAQLVFFPLVRRFEGAAFDEKGGLAILDLMSVQDARGDLHS